MIEQLIDALQEAGLLLKDGESSTLSPALSTVQSLLHDEDIADALWLRSFMEDEAVPEGAENRQKDKDENSQFQRQALDAGAAVLSEPEPPSTISAYTPDSINESTERETENSESGLPLQIQTAPALPNSLAIGRALRPLMRKAPSRTQVVLDELATVNRIAEEEIWVPVLQSALERWFDLELVIESSELSFIWEQTLTEFQQQLERQGAFRKVRTWSVTESKTESPQLLPRRFSQDAQSAKITARGVQPTQQSAVSVTRSPRELIDASGRSLVLYVSDCRSQLWCSGVIHDWLALWAQHGPTTVAQLLPENLWQQTDLRVGFRVQVSAFAPGASNSKLELHDEPSHLSSGETLTLPVVSLTAAALQQWARVVTAAGQQRLPARLFDLSWVKDPERMETADWDVIEPETPEARIELFQATASLPAQRLARLMSVVPAELPVVHLIQQTFFEKEEASPVHVAEVYDSCLMEPQKASEGESASFEFVRGVREQLNRINTIEETFDVLDVISQEVARTLGFEIKSFTALLLPDLVLDEAQQAAMLPFATLTMQVLEGLGGEYSEFVRDVRERYNYPPTIVDEEEEEDLSGAEELSWAAFPPLEEFEFIDAQFGESLPEFPPLLQTETFTAITLELGEETELSLESFEFITATFDLIRRGLLRRLQWQIQRQQGRANRFVEQLTPNIPLEMVAIPAGSFFMGDSLRLRRDESPQHKVTLEPFFMGRYPITQDQWRVVAQLPQIRKELPPDPSNFKGEIRPVENVSWYDVMEFCARLSAHTRREYRLPTEAEWEYACRAGTTTDFSFGNMITTEVANYNGTEYSKYYGGEPQAKDRGATTAVNHSSFANAFGLCDMHGNVFEWCQDYWHDNYEDAPEDGAAWLVGGDQRRRVRRGGSWAYDPWVCRSTYRGYDDPDYRDDGIGFRVCCSALRAVG